MISANETEGSDQNCHDCMPLEEIFSPFPGQFITRDSDRDGSSTGQQVSMMVITQGLMVSYICFLPHRSTRRFCKYLHFFHCPLLLSTATGVGFTSLSFLYLRVRGKVSPGHVERGMMKYFYLSSSAYLPSLGRERYLGRRHGSSCLIHMAENSPEVSCCL